MERRRRSLRPANAVFTSRRVAPRMPSAWEFRPPREHSAGPIDKSLPSHAATRDDRCPCYDAAMSRLGLVVWLPLIALALACDADDPVDVSYATCPNTAPVHGTACPEAGLSCSYFTGCSQYVAATCEASGTWSFEDTCVPPTGLGGTGGTGGSGDTGGSSGSGGTGGAGDHAFRCLPVERPVFK